MKAFDLLQYGTIDYWHEKNKAGYQRPLQETRVIKATRYLLDEEGVFPTSILINIRGEVEFFPSCSINGFGELGVLVIPDKSLPLRIIDGQHRIMAVRLAAREDTEFENYALPVSILTLDDRYEEMRQFYIVNSRQKSVPTSLAQRHLIQAILRKGEWEVLPFETRKKVLAAEAVPIVDILRTDPNSPWFGKVFLPDERKQPYHIMSQTSLADSIGHILKELTKEERNELRENPMPLASLLIDYWNSLKEIFPEAFETPSDFTLQKTNGCYIFHLIFPQIIALCEEANDFSKEKMKCLLTKMFETFRLKEQIPAIRSDFWHRTKGHPLAIGTGMKSIRDLASKFLDSLP
jgi:DGQHR domain-containing protein